MGYNPESLEDGAYRIIELPAMGRGEYRQVHLVWDKPPATP